MSSEHSGWKQKLMHELREMLVLSGYLAFFFCALTTYKMFLLNQYEIDEWSYGFALINALVVAKVIMIGDLAKIGKKHESKPIFFAAVWKSFLYGLLVFAFHIVEEVVKRMIHGASVEKASREIRFEEMGARTVVVFCCFLPLFMFLELRRRMGEEEFRALFFGKKDEGTKRLQEQS
jgi:hypothetical protein